MSSSLRGILIGVLALSLLLSLVTANTVIGVDRTVLNEEFVKDGLESEGAYDALSIVMIEGIQEDISPDEQGVNEEFDDGPPMDQILSDVITADYLQAEIESNIGNIYGYIHGDTEELVIVFDVKPIKDGIATNMAVWLAYENDLSEFDEALGLMLQSEADYEAVRTDFKEVQLERIQADTDEELTREELEAQYDESREDIRQELLTDLEKQMAGDEMPAGLKDAMIELGTIRIEAQLDEKMTYAEFQAEVDDLRSTLAQEFENFIRSDLDQEMPDQMVLTDEMDEDELAPFETLRTAASIVGVLVFILPLGAIGISAGIVRFASRRSTGLFIASGTAVLAGILGLAVGTLGATLATSFLESLLLAEGAPVEMVAAITGFVGRIMAVLTVQSLVLVGLGAVGIGIGIGFQRSHFPYPNVPGTRSREASPNPVPGERN